jgi:hypothetical protein
MNAATQRRGLKSGIHDAGSTEGRCRQVWLARPHDDGGQAQGARIDEALARIVRAEQLAHHFLAAVGGLRRGAEIVGDHVGQVAAIGRQRRREHKLDGLRQRAARLEHDARAVEVDAVAEVEIALRTGADHAREMEDGTGIRRDERRDGGLVVDLADAHLDARIGGHVETGGHVEQHDLRDAVRLAVAARQAAALQDLGRQLLAEHARTAGDDNTHIKSLPFFRSSRCRAVPLRGTGRGSRSCAAGFP